MARSTLGILFSFFILAFVVNGAMAKETSTTKNGKKQALKSQLVKKQAPPARHAKANAASRPEGKRKARTSQAVSSPARRKTGYQRVAFTPSAPVLQALPTAGDLAGLHLTHDPLDLKSNAALVMDQVTSEILFEKNSRVALPIASITKLMTSLVVLDAHQRMDEVLTVTDEDLDREKFTHSRLRIGSQLTRADMLHIALMSSENRAASALGRHYPGGLPAFVAAMNAKARTLGMTQTRYVDSSGLSSQNVSSAGDLAKLVVAAYQHPLIRTYSTHSEHEVEPGGPVLHYRNSNHLVLNPTWEIGLQKTGYIAEAGRCLVMQATIDGRPVVMVFLDSKGKESRLADAGRIRKWLEQGRPGALTKVARQS
jgi:D-alanyl-D-alanine endopeptidase (penicillin-binding protein 7)